MNDANRTSSGPLNTQDDLARMRAALEKVSPAPTSLFPEILETKACFRCHEVKPLDQFIKQSSKSDGYTTLCKTCRRKGDRAKYTPEKGRAGYFKYAYGLTLEDYDRMLEEQHHRCAICGAPDSGQQVINNHGKRFHVDHDHETKQVRALLCSACNRGIGCFNEDPEWMFAAIGYLRKWEARRLGVVS